MKRIVLLALYVLLIPAAAAQAVQLCLCTVGCFIASNPYPPGANQPTTCDLYKSGVLVGSAAVFPSDQIPTSNSLVCAPASLPYNPGVAGSVACKVPLPSQAAGTTVNVTMRAANGAGVTGDSAVYTFQSVSALPTIPQVPTGLRPI
jgi:hypothetical protein